MAAHFTTTRNCELSTLKYLETNLGVDWAGVNIVKSWTELANKTNPIVCVELEETEYVRHEIGSTAYRDTYIFTIDVFATSNGMRLDLSQYVMDKIMTGWVYYTISRGAGKTMNYVSAGRCSLDQILDNSKVPVNASSAARDKYRQSIVISVRVGVV